MLHVGDGDGAVGVVGGSQEERPVHVILRWRRHCPARPRAASSRAPMT